METQSSTLNTTTFRNANLLDIPSVLWAFEEGVHLGVFSSDYMEWFHMLKHFKELFGTVVHSWRGKGLADQGNHFLIGEANKETAAFALLNTIGNAIFINTFVVLPEYRNIGIGQAFLKHIIDIAPRPCRLYCECSPNAKAMRRLVSQLGFKTKRVARPTKGNRFLPYLMELKLAGPDRPPLA